MIASVSHILIEPAIVLQCWPYLMICIVTATVFSLVSARFANRVDGKVVSYVTGAILLGLGLTLVFLNYKDQINMVLFLEFWKLMGIYLGFIVAFAAVLILLRFLIRIPDYIFRKLLHTVAFTSVLPLVLGTDIWWIAVLAEIVFLIIVIFALHFFEHFAFYSALFVEKGKHEVITSFILLFGMITAMLAVFWGGFGNDCAFIAVAALMVWGPGDAAAAIIGRNFGKHHLSGKWIEGIKSVEGTIAMGVTSFICTFAALYFLSGFSLVQILDLCLIIAPVSAFVELYTKHGLDTITVPIAASLILGTAALIL